MCQINITQVTGNPISGGVNVLVKGTSSNCKHIRVRFNSGGIWATDQFIVVGSGGVWSATFSNLPHNCGDSYEVEACCTDDNGNVNLNCCDSTGGTIDCPNYCCVAPTVNIGIADCDNNGKRLVTFTINFPVKNGSCLPYVFDVDYGDGNNSPTQLVNSTGVNTIVLTHLYDTFSSLNYTASINHTLPTGCPSQSINIDLEPCIKDCCPNVDVQINVKDCDDNCKRKVELVSTFNPPNTNCPYASMQWEYYDSNNNFIQYGQSFNNLMSSPHIDTVYFSSTQSPITAKLKIANPPLDCPEIIKTINIPDCKGCPEITSFTSSIKDCIKRADKCCRKVGFEIKGVFCGNPKIRIEYGDGNWDEHTIQNQGLQTIFFDNEYCSAGNYNVVLKTIDPTGCPSKSININVPKCDSKECSDTTEPEPTKPSPFCPCCILLLLSIIAYFVLWALGVYQEQIVVLGTTLNVGAFAGGIFSLLIILATLCFIFNKKCDCPACRIAKCTMWASILAIVIILILLAFGVAPNWLWAAITAFLLFLTALGVHRSKKCRNFWKTGKCE